MNQSGLHPSRHSLSRLTVRRTWVVNSLSVRSIEYSSTSSLEDCTSTQEADDPPDPPNVLLTSSTKSGHGKQTGGLMAWRGFLWLFCGSGRMGEKAESIMPFFNPHAVRLATHEMEGPIQF